MKPKCLMLPKNRSLVSFKGLKINSRGKTCLNAPIIQKAKSFSCLKAFALKFKLIY